MVHVSIICTCQVTHSVSDYFSLLASPFINLFLCQSDRDSGRLMSVCHFSDQQSAPWCISLLTYHCIYYRAVDDKHNENTIHANSSPLSGYHYLFAHSSACLSVCLILMQTDDLYSLFLGTRETKPKTERKTDWSSP